MPSIPTPTTPFAVDGEIFFADGGLETTLVFHEGLDLPAFASFPLVDSEDGRETLRNYFREYAEIAGRLGVGAVFETPTWRASGDWGRRLGHDAADLARLNEASVGLLQQVRDEYAAKDTRIVVSGCLGPRGDGYIAGDLMSAQEAQAYHRPQIEAFARAGADIVTFVTATYAEEAIGITRAARDAGLPAVVSFTVETDGRTLSGCALEGGAKP